MGKKTSGSYDITLKKKEIEDYYRYEAPEVPGTGSSPPFQQQILKEVLDRLRLDPMSRILDLGSGDGLNILTLIDYFLEIIAVDISLLALSRCKRTFYRFGLDWRMKFITGNIVSLPFIDHSFDLIICTETLEHVVDLDAAVREISRVLKENGFVFISCPVYWNLIGLYKRYNDKKMGRLSWEPWGTHKEGLEKHMTPKLLEKLLKRSFKIVFTRGGGYILPWFFPLFSILPKLREYDKIHLFFRLGKLPLFKKMAMHYYILAKG